jgi:signal transduction histidine kinase
MADSCSRNHARSLSIGMLGPCLAVGLVLLFDWGEPPGTGEFRVALAGAILGGGVLATLTAGVLAWRSTRSYHRSLDEVGRQIRIAAERLGCELPASGAAPENLIAQVQALVDGIERIIEDYQQREREVLRADQLSMVGQLAAGVAHELRNPLTSIKLLIQANLRQTLAMDIPADDLAVIEHEIRRMEKCLQRFLDFARPPRPERRPINLATLAARTLALVEGRANKQHVTLQFDHPENPVMVEADEDQIQQLLVNLVLNALDAMQEEGHVEVQLAPGADGFVELHVLDRGPGIATELFPRLFDPFVSTKETGIGLGLAVSHRIAANHGGRLSAVNRPDGGACFTVRLPVSQRVVPSAI